jgi:SAM-dependent methyltransferase
MRAPTAHPFCEVCGSPKTEFLFKARDKNRRIDQREFDVMRCVACGVGFTLPKLPVADLAKYYPQEYYSIDNNLKLERATRPHNRRRVRRIQRFVSQGKLLDIGAGTGMFLKIAHENGFDVEGLEISEDAAVVGRTTWRLNIRTGNLHETAITPDSYDVVTLGHVYEHLHEPRAAAKQLFAMIKPGGLLVLAVPNFDSVQARVFRAAWFHLDVPRHLFHYTPAGMKLLMERAGFNVVDVNFFSAEHNWAGILGSVMALSRPGESFLHKLLRKAAGLTIAKALAFVEAMSGKGGTFELYAIKAIKAIKQ